MKKTYFYLFLLVFSTSSFGARKNVNTMKTELSNLSSKVNKVAAQIKSLDKRLAKTNDSYLVSVKEIELIEKSLQDLKLGLKSNALKISTNYNNAKKALNLYLLESSDSENDNAVIHKKIYMEVLRKKLVDLQSAQKESNQLLEAISLYDQKLTETKAGEEEIYNLIVELENAKKELSQDYISNLESKNHIEIELDKFKAVQRAKAKQVTKKASPSTKVLIPMTSPLDDYLELKKNKDAMVFKYKNAAAVNAPSAGKIVYTGELANYGNLIMIDHGSDVKSVILADMLIKVKKGDSVKKAQVIAYTVSDPGMVKSLHYEIRKKSKPINAFNWVSKTKKRI
jgi:murein DD-endopeptidase MepM/ murein hydrolase activator NlpD